MDKPRWSGCSATTSRFGWRYAHAQPVGKVEDVVDCVYNCEPVYRMPAPIRALAAVVVVCLLAGCTAAHQPSGSERQRLVDRLNRALDNHDEADLTRVFAAAAAPRRELLVANLRQLDSAQFQIGDDDVLQVSWRAVPDDEQAWQFVSAPMTCTNSCALTDLRPIAGHPAPIWVTGAISLRRQMNAVVIAPDAQPWLPLAADAQAGVVAAQLGALTDGWNQLLVVEVPANKAAFEAVMGVQASDFAGTGAVTWTADDAAPEATTPASRRIVVNPDAVASLDGARRGFLLAHEAVHVATGGLGRPAPGALWVSEGLAEHVALGQWPSQAQASASLLRQHCPLPPEAPTDDEFTGNQAALAYARAALAVSQLVTGPSSTTQITTAWAKPGSVQIDFTAACR